jgi:hypothetical protein
MTIFVSLNGIREGIQQIPGEMEAINSSEALQIWGSLIRGYRNYLLRECDWTSLLDNNLDSTDRSRWAAYRTLLRDIPNAPNFPYITWPTPPSLSNSAGNDTGEHS